MIRLEVVSSFVSGGPFDSVLHDWTVAESRPALVRAWPAGTGVWEKGDWAHSALPPAMPLVVAVRKKARWPYSRFLPCFAPSMGRHVDWQVSTGADGQQPRSGPGGRWPVEYAGGGGGLS